MKINEIDVYVAALKWCEQDKINPDAFSLSKDMRTRTALENRKMEIEDEELYVCPHCDLHSNVDKVGTHCRSCRNELEDHFND